MAIVYLQSTKVLHIISSHCWTIFNKMGYCAACLNWDSRACARKYIATMQQPCWVTELRLLGLNACLGHCSCGYYILRLYCTVAVSAAAPAHGRRELVAVNKKAAEKSAFRRTPASAGTARAAGRGHANRLSLAHSPFAFSFCLPLHYYPTSARLTYVAPREY